MEKWSSEIISKIDSSLAGTKERDLRFFRVDEFKRNIQRVDEFSAHCPFCQKQKQEIAECVEKIEEAINFPGQPRRNYDRLISRLSNHMQKEHGFFTPYYFSYLFSFFGMVAGIVLGYILQKIVPAYNWEMLIIGFSIGLITGYFWGTAKDNKIRSEKRLM